MRNSAFDVIIGSCIQRYRQQIHLATNSIGHLNISVGKTTPTQAKIRFNNVFSGIHKNPKPTATGANTRQ
jgi:hypothetical protein